MYVDIVFNLNIYFYFYSFPKDPGLSVILYIMGRLQMIANAHFVQDSN